MSGIVRIVLLRSTNNKKKDRTGVKDFKDLTETC